MKELEGLLKIYPGPGCHQKKFINITCYVDFEPFGRAAEGWDVVWKLELLTIPSSWYNYKTSQWEKCSSIGPMSFRGPSLESVISRAKTFMRAYAGNHKEQ
jgi:hypothetical protein